jgi:hypothetical protein
MKSELSPIPYPTNKTEEYKWGFDVYQPEGTPMAWIVDWTSAGAGSGVSFQRTMEVLRFKVGVDLSQISVDEMAAALSMRLKLQWHGFWKTLEDKFGVAKAVEVGREMSHPNGRTVWKRIQNNFGTPVPLDKIIWYQDVVNRQGKWDTFKTKVTRHFRACSDTDKAIDYYSKGGVSHGTTDHRPILAG